ncbi:MAG TPA: TraB/GumN family protein [Bdellovibrionota bacterium]|nr:TraB/GumN family protein [Bdellovibrionota bacterium]
MQRSVVRWTLWSAVALALNLGCQARDDYEDVDLGNSESASQSKKPAEPQEKQTRLHWSLDPALFANELYTYSPIQRKIFLEESLKRAMPLPEFFEVVHKEAAPDIILFGENHAVGAGDLGYSQIIEKLRAVGFTVDCIFFELEVRQRHALKRVRTKQIAIKNFLRRFPSAHPRHALDSLQAHIDDPNPAKFFAVDYNVNEFVEKLSESDFRRGYYLLNERNRVMAPRITTLIREESCQHSLYIGGYAHLAGEQSLGALLQRDGYTTFSIALLKTADVPGNKGQKSEAELDASPWVWKDAPWNPPSLESPKAFAPPRSPSQILYRTPIKEVGLVEWNDFDGVILFN